MLAILNGEMGSWLLTEPSSHSFNVLAFMAMLGLTKIKIIQLIARYEFCQTHKMYLTYASYPLEGNKSPSQPPYG
jgi:hypothetical protein